MNITFTPQLRDCTLEMMKRGDILVINGIEYDFSPLENEDEIHSSAIASEFISDVVTRKDGVINLTVILPITVDATHEQCWPTPQFNIPDGPITLPGG